MNTQDKKLTKVQKEIFDSCEPLILKIQENAIQYYNNIIDNFETAKKSTPNNVMFSKFLRNYAKDNDTIFDVIYSIYTSKDSNYYSTINDYVIDTVRKETYYKRIKEMIKEYNIAKLTDALNRYVTSDFIIIKNIFIQTGTKGFEITATLFDTLNRKWYFETKAIGAGGYNIQIWHYRYLINLSCKEISKQMVKQRINEQVKKEKEEKKEQRKIERNAKQKEMINKKIASIFYLIKSRINNWETWERINLRNYIQKGSRTQNEMDETQQKVNTLKNFISKYNYKRAELTEMARINKITIDTFKEIEYILEDKIHFDDYKRLKRMITKE